MKEKKNKGGRPKKYTDEELFHKKVDEYFKECDDLHRPYTFSGLALKLGFQDTKSIRNYSREEKFFPSVNYARMKILDQYERELFRNQGSTQGVQFALKNNFNEYKDETEIKATVSIEEYLSDKKIEM